MKSFSGMDDLKSCGSDCHNGPALPGADGDACLVIMDLPVIQIVGTVDF
jgi:hypothetical protein